MNLRQWGRAAGIVLLSACMSLACTSDLDGRIGSDVKPKDAASSTDVKDASVPLVEPEPMVGPPPSDDVEPSVKPMPSEPTDSGASPAPTETETDSGPPPVSLPTDGGTIDADAGFVDAGPNALRLVSSSPENGELSVSPNLVVVLEFSRAVRPGSGQVELLQTISQSAVETVDPTDERVVFEENTVTIHWTTTLARSTTYSIVVAPGTIVDEEGLAFAGLQSPQDLSFTTRAPDGLTLMDTVPENGASDVPLSSDLRLKFSGHVVAGLQGNLGLVDATAQAVVASIPLTDATRVIFNDDTIEVDLFDELQYSTDYYVTLDSDAILSAQGAPYEGFMDDSVLSFTTAMPPPLVLTETTPTDDAVDVDPDVSLVFTFSEPIAPGAGSVSVYRVSDDMLVEAVNVMSPAVAIANDAMTVDLATTLDNLTEYYVQASAGVVSSAMGAPFAGIADTGTFSFLTAESPPPPLALVDTFPTDNATAVMTNTNLTLVFDQNVVAGSGSVSIFQEDGTLVETIPVTDVDRVTIIDATVTVNPAATLDGNTNYYVLVGAGALVSMEGASFSGITSPAALNFTTETTFSLLEVEPQDGAQSADPGTHLTLTFSDAVQVGTGTVEVRATSGGTVIESIPIDDPRVVVDGETLTIDLDSVLSGGTDYHVLIEADAIRQMYGPGSFSGFSTTSGWNFTTSEVAVPGDVGTGLLLWLDAAYDPGLKTTSGSVLLWADRSGLRNNVRQATSSSRPALVAGAFPNGAGVRFDGNNDSLSAATGFNLSSFEGFVVWQSPTAPSGGEQRSILVNGNNFELNHGDNNGWPRSVAVCTGSDCNTGGSWYAARFEPDPPAGAPQLWNFGFDFVTTSLFARSRGSAPVIQTAPAAAPVAPTTDFSVGGDPFHCAEQGDCPFNGDVAEVLLYSRKLTQAERLAVTAYLRQKWGIPAPTCASGEALGPNGSCYLIVPTHNNWWGARGSCQGRRPGWDLATIRSQLEHDFIAPQLTTDSWIGASDNSSPNVWRWVNDEFQFWSGGSAASGGMATNNAYTNWRDGEPSGGDVEGCGRYSWLNNSWLWADTNCNESHHGYVCEGPGQ